MTRTDQHAYYWESTDGRRQAPFSFHRHDYVDRLCASGSASKSLDMVPPTEERIRMGGFGVLVAGFENHQRISGALYFHSPPHRITGAGPLGTRFERPLLLGPFWIHADLRPRPAQIPLTRTDRHPTCRRRCPSWTSCKRACARTSAHAGIPPSSSALGTPTSYASPHDSCSDASSRQTP